MAKIKTNSKVNNVLIIPSIDQYVAVNQKVYKGFFYTFYCILQGKRKDSGTMVTIHNDDYNQRVLVFDNNQLYINGTLQSIEYEYLTPIYFDSNGKMEGFGEVV